MEQNYILHFLEWAILSIAQSWWKKVCCYSTELLVCHSVKENVLQEKAFKSRSLDFEFFIIIGMIINLLLLVYYWLISTEC